MKSVLWKPNAPIANYLTIFCGLVILVEAAYVIHTVSKGSKSFFAYTLMLFTVLLGVSFMLQGLSMCILEEVMPQPHYLY
jgi:hypothetical protein